MKIMALHILYIASYIGPVAVYTSSPQADPQAYIQRSWANVVLKRIP